MTKTTPAQNKAPVLDAFDNYAADALQSVCKALSYLKPAPNDFLERWPVSKRVNTPALMMRR